MPLTSTERQHRFQDRRAAIDDKINAAIQNINWERRNYALQSLENFIDTYSVGIILDSPPSDNARKAIRDMDYALQDSRPYMINLPRGAGKSCFSVSALMYQILSGRRKFVVIISANQEAAYSLLSDCFRFISDGDSAIVQDFPESLLPFVLCSGSYRRIQTYNGYQLELIKNNSVIRFGRMVREDGTEYETSQSMITCRGITSSIRGMRNGRYRPDCVLIDDPQTAESAQNQESVIKLLDTIKKDILNLGGRKKLSVLLTATPLEIDDLCQKLKEDKNWKTTSYKAILHDSESPELWKQYFEIFDDENIEDKPHSDSLKFYKEHFEAMNQGVEVFQPERFSEEDGHISAIQKLYEIKHLIGEEAFNCEYQMTIKRKNAVINISPSILAKHQNELEELQIPEGSVGVFGSVDINSSYGFTAVVCSFLRDTTSFVLYHNVFPVRIDQKLNDQQYAQAVHSELANVLGQISRIGIKIDGIGIDAGGRQFDIVTNAVKTIRVGIPLVAMLGRNCTTFNPLVRSRLRNAVGETVLCGDSQELLKSGSGKKWLAWNADFYKETAQRALLSVPGSSGSCSLFRGDTRVHSDFLTQICNEKLQYKIEKNGRFFYSWRDSGIHDYGDCMAMVMALSQSQNILPSGGQSTVSKLLLSRHKQRIRIV